ncbi:unnamed protein product [Paramecium octaurelia]|uniref:Uncharacterized protein n=1 Tax=Paramecium octaurelia TaxID=43137 RepID=A0A8S1Y3V1_PAROT|nr:unnamed protein product [Paramecium octaurelia]
MDKTRMHYVLNSQIHISESNRQQQLCLGDSNTSVICTQCAAGYFLVAGICIQPNNCAQMNLVTGTCDTCVVGYYFTPIPSCKFCNHGITSQISINYTCAQYNDQYYQSSTQSKSDLSSIQNDANAGQCFACSANITKCIKCQNSTICDKCLDGYYYTASSDQSNKGTCTKCMDLCLSCSNSDTCDTCDTVNNYIYLQTTIQNACALCTSISGYQTCSTQGGQLTCTACSTGYLFDSKNVMLIVLPTNVLILIIKSNVAILKHKQHLDNALILTIKMITVHVNYVLHLQPIVKSVVTIVKYSNCNLLIMFNKYQTYQRFIIVQVSSSKLSQLYSDKFNKYSSMWYSSFDANYIRCSKSNGTITIIQCQNEYFLFNNTCVSAKEQNIQAANLKLQTCQTIATGKQCQSRLPAALRTNPPQSGVCSYCNCSSNKGGCTATVSGANSSVTCSPHPASSDIQGSETCCGLGLIQLLDTDKCVPQGATEKQQLLASNANGQTCDMGYYYNTNNLKCEICISNCDSCADATPCKTCSLNYTLLKTSKGVSYVLIKCLVVDSTKGCTACQYGFYLLNINGIGYCLQCLSPLTNSICRAYSNQAPNVTVSPAASVAVSSNPSYVCDNGDYWNSQYCSPCKPVPTTGKNTSPMDIVYAQLELVVQLLFASQVSTNANPYFNNFPSQCSACTNLIVLHVLVPPVCTTCQKGYFWQT